MKSRVIFEFGENCMFDLEEELKNLPIQPGVYLMHNKTDEIIYVGKAKILKNRVRQYFQNSKNHSPKVLAMVSNIAYFEYIVTDTEIEALCLECNLIKKYKPKYNILLKDDKHYPYIKVTINKPYPEIMMSRTLKNDGAKYFGPYSGMQTVRGTLEIVQKIFKPPTCKRKFPDDIGKGRPCLNYHINTCFAPCIEGNITKDEYRKVFFDICAFLEGSHKELIDEFTKKMLEASNSTEFEKAASYRDKIEAIKKFEEKQKIINADKQIDTDIIAYAKSGEKTFIEIFFVRLGKITGRKSYKIDDTKYVKDTEVLSDFIKQFYIDVNSMPQEILLQNDINDFDIISKWLSDKNGKKVKITVPQKGQKKSLLDMVRKNAEISAENYRLANIKLSESKNEISNEIAKKLNLDKVPKRIESYDISNIQGTDNVASMVVFVNGKPSKKDYRHFKIKSFEGSNDYMAMQEVIYRRFRHAFDELEQIKDGKLQKDEAKFLPLPDLILLDGGKGQISSVKEIMEIIDMDIPVFGIVKNSKHKTRGLLSENGEVEISQIDRLFKFLTNLQDEVHRVAVSYHQKLRSDRLKKSELDEIKGVGEVKKSQLIKAFKSINNIKNATITELENVVDKRTAQAIFEYFNNKNME